VGRLAPKRGPGGTARLAGFSARLHAEDPLAIGTRLSKRGGVMGSLARATGLLAVLLCLLTMLAVSPVNTVAQGRQYSEPGTCEDVVLETSCGFPVALHYLRCTYTNTYFLDADGDVVRMASHGVIVVELTNVDTGQVIVRKAQGPWQYDVATDTNRAPGPWLFFDVDVLIYTKGLAIWTPTELLKWTGNAEDLCVTLAEP
jgi:hypothetical protein